MKRNGSKPQIVVRKSAVLNEFLKIEGTRGIWVGDKLSATRFDSKYAAKQRVELVNVDIPSTRCFEAL